MLKKFRAYSIWWIVRLPFLASDVAIVIWNGRNKKIRVLPSPLSLLSNEVYNWMIFVNTHKKLYRQWLKRKELL